MIGGDRFQMLPLWWPEAECADCALHTLPRMRILHALLVVRGTGGLSDGGRVRKWLMGLKCGGLMEMPEWSVENVHEVEADNLTEAKDKWWEAVEEMGELKWGWGNP